MATKKAAKKFLIILSVFLLLLAGVGVAFGMSLKRKHSGDLRTTFLDGFDATALKYYTIGHPDVHVSDVEIIEHVVYYVEPLDGTSLAFNPVTSILSASGAKFSGQLAKGDMIEFRSPTDEENIQTA